MKVRGNIEVRGSIGGTRRMAIFRDEKSAGSHGGNLTNAAWNTRTLNTVVLNDLGATLSSNRITLPAGVYFIDASVTNMSVADTRARIQNITAGTTLLVGLSVHNDTSEDVGIITPVRGIITLTVESQIELQNYISSGANTVTEGGSQVGASGIIEVYSEVVITSYET